MATLRLTAECCGDVEVPGRDAIVAVCDLLPRSTLLCGCSRCNEEVVKRYDDPRLTELLVMGGVRLAVNADIDDPAVRARLLAGESIVQSVDDLVKAQVARGIVALSTIGDTTASSSGLPAETPAGHYFNLGAGLDAQP